MSPAISLLIISHVAGDVLAASLSTLCFQTLDPAQFEIVLVLDGCSADRLPNHILCSVPHLRILHLERSQGRSAARNAGLRAVSGEWVVSLDGDMIAKPTLLDIYHDLQRACPGVYIGERNYSLVPPLTEDLQSAESLSAFLSRPTCKLDYRHGFLHRTSGLRNSAEPFWALSTCNCSYPTAAARQCGGFDEAMNGWGLEDQEFGYRLWVGGLRVNYARGALGVHIEHERSKKLELISWIKNRDYCMMKHGYLFSNPYRSMSQPVLVNPVPAAEGICLRQIDEPEIRQEDSGPLGAF